MSYITTTEGDLDEMELCPHRESVYAVVGGTSGFHFVDASNPYNPFVITTIIPEGSAENIEFSNDGNIIYVAVRDEGTYIYDCKDF